MSLPQMMDKAEAQAGAEWNPNALVLPGDLSFEQWEQVGATLSTMERGVNWWIGDWLNYGERAYGEKYAQAVEETGKRRQTLMNLASVAGRIPPDERRPDLSWSAHRAVAYLEPADRERLLDEAESKGWGSRELEDAVRNQTTKAIPPVPSATAPDLPARVDSAPDEGPPLSLMDDEPDVADELKRADAEIRALQQLVDSLQATDSGREIAQWAQKYAQLEGRLRQETAVAAEAKRQAKYQGDLLKKVRAVLGVESNSAILQALMDRQVA